MHTVIVTAIGSFSAGAVLKSCKEAGLRVVGTDIYPAEYIPESQNVSRFVRVPRFDARSAYTEAISRLAREEKAAGIIPLTDAELDVLSAHREQFHPTLLWSPSDQAVCLSRDKAKSACVAAKVLSRMPREIRDRFRVIPEKWLASCEEKELGEALPLILKPVDGRSSEGLFRIFDRASLSEALRKIREEKRENAYLVQPYLDGRVVCVDTVRNGQNETAALPREEYLRTHNGAGLSVCVFRDAQLERVCGELSEALSIYGTVNYEWIHTPDDRYFFLECNPRFSGGTGFSVKAGFDVVRAHVSVFQGECVPLLNEVEEMWITKKYIEVVTKSC